MSDRPKDLRYVPEVERWLRGVVAPIKEATIIDPSRSIPTDEARAHFAARRVARP